MNDDRTDLNDLAGENKNRVTDFVRQYDEWAARCEVRPWPLAR